MRELESERVSERESRAWKRVKDGEEGRKQESEIVKESKTKRVSEREL